MPRGQTKLVAATTSILIAAVAAAFAGCAPTATGGAVELSWRLRPASGPLINNTGPFITCDSGEPGAGTVGFIQVGWTDGEVTSSQAPFKCDNGHGVTGFDLPEGIALITVTPLCADGTAPDPATYSAPAPIERDVIVGETISLDAVELVLQVSSCIGAGSGSGSGSGIPPQPCICGAS